MWDRKHCGFRGGGLPREVRRASRAPPARGPPPFAGPGLGHQPHVFGAKTSRKIVLFTKKHENHRNSSKSHKNNVKWMFAKSEGNYHNIALGLWPHDRSGRGCGAGARHGRSRPADARTHMRSRGPAPGWEPGTRSERRIGQPNRATKGK